jgi:hypothetical protein
MAERYSIERPDCERAHSFEMGRCGDPTCGLHLIPRRRDNSPICEVVIGRSQMRDMLALIHDEGLDL